MGTVFSVETLNRTEDAKELRKVLEALRRLGYNYRESFEYFRKHDPSIDLARFDELCQIADYA